MTTLIVFADGACRPNPGEGAIGVQIEDVAGCVVAQISNRIGYSTNNMAEYVAVVSGLRKAIELGADTVNLYIDSELVARQLSGKYKVKDRALQVIYQEARDLLLLRLSQYLIVLISSSSNKAAHALAQQAFPAPAKKKCCGADKLDCCQ